MASRLVPRLGASVLTVGALVAVVGYAAVGWTVDRANGTFTLASQVVPMVVTGVGVGLVMPPLLGIVLSQVHGHMAGLGSGVLITTQQACIGLGSAVVGTVYLSWGGPSGFAGTAYLLAAAMVVAAVLTRFLPAARQHS